MVRRVHLLMYVTAVSSLLLFARPAAAGPISFTGTGANPAALLPTIDAYRAALGNPNNANAPGPLAGGRREINWDGGGSATTISADPLLAFLNIRGAQFDTPGTGFIQAPVAAFATEFGQPGYASEFQTFSPQRLFAPIGSNITDVTFAIPGTNGAVPASVAGFGAIFTDVDAAASTSLQFFSLANTLLAPALFAPALDNGLSFAGVIFDAGEQIGRVRITSGAVALGAADSLASDAVAIDDVLYAEPRVIPEPSTLALLGFALLGVGRAVRRRTR